MAQGGGVSKFIRANEEYRQANGRTSSDMLFDTAEHERRRRAADGLRVSHPQPGRPTSHTSLQMSLRAPPYRPSTPRHSSGRQQREVTAREPPALSRFDDTDAEAADETTMSNFTDPIPRVTQEMGQPESIAGGSGYGGDNDGLDASDDDFSAPIDQANSETSHDLNMKHDLANISMDEGEDTQQVQAPFMSSQIDRIIEYHGHVMAKDYRSLRQQKARDRVIAQQGLESQHQNVAPDIPQLKSEIPFRVGSAPPESQPNKLRSIKIEEQYDHEGSIDGLNSEELNHDLVPSPEAQRSQFPLFKPSVLTQRRSIRAATSSSMLPYNPEAEYSPTPKKASESTLDQTSGYTSESSELMDIRTKKKRLRPAEEQELDYDLTTLAKLPFSTLRNEPFDVDPSLVGRAAPPPTAATNPKFPSTPLGAATRATITGQINKIAVPATEPWPNPTSNPLPHTQNNNSNTTWDPSLLTPLKTPDERLAYFSSLSLTDWESCGDWLLERLGHVVSRTSTARKNRRGVAHEFELEIERRYDEVQRKRDGIDELLADMRGGAKQVLRAGGSPAKMV